MVDKVTLWKARTGMHYETQAEAERAEAREDMAILFNRHGLTEDDLANFTRAILDTGDMDIVGINPAGIDTIRNYLGAVSRARASNPKGSSSNDIVQSMTTAPVAAPVHGVVRRRGIRAAADGPSDPEADSTSRSPIPSNSREPPWIGYDYREWGDGVRWVADASLTMERPYSIHGNEWLPSGPARPYRQHPRGYGSISVDDGFDNGRDHPPRRRQGIGRILPEHEQY
jgi:hypothetical protein